MLKNNWVFVLLLSIMVLPFVSCDDEVTYSDMKERERDAVNKFIKDKNIKIITYKEFVAKGYVTDVMSNEFVEIDEVYMQIVNNPKNADDARRIESGDERNILVRYFEYNIQDGDTISSNKYMSEPDEMRVENNNGTYTATFTSGVMPGIYGNTVPTGWLVPMNYLYFTRKQGNLAEVNLIVPHSKGTMNAATYVFPCLYNMTLQPENLYDYDE